MTIIKLSAAQYQVAKEMGFDHTRLLHVYENGVYLFSTVNQSDYRAIQCEQRRQRLADEVFQVR